MKSITKTTTDNLFNLEGILTHAGDHAGQYSWEANDIINDGDEFMYGPDGWSDIMVNERTGKLYAVLSKGALTEFGTELYYAELEESDCPKAFAAAKEKIANY